MACEKASDIHEPSSDDVHIFLNGLGNIPWFHRVGTPITESAVKQVFSWDKAWECLQDEHWINLPFHREVDQAHPMWARAYDIALAASSNPAYDHELQPGVNASTQAAWDAASAAYQIAIGKKDGFFVKLFYWYTQGHWPCGWVGKYPKGKLIVF